jgi:hypothetical protein
MMLPGVLFIILVKIRRLMCQIVLNLGLPIRHCHIFIRSDIAPAISLYITGS